MTKLSPKMQEKVASGKIELIETEANDPVINEEMDVVVDAEDMEDELIRKKLMSSSIPGTDHRRTFQAAKVSGRNAPISMHWKIMTIR